MVSKKRSAKGSTGASVLDKRSKVAAAAVGNDNGNGVEYKPSDRWVNKQRTLIFSSRGTSYRARHVMEDLRTMMPHSKSDTKLDRKDDFKVINEICELKNCNNCVFLEMRKKQDLYMWLSRAPDGPSAKFHVENIHTMSELKMIGNCLKGTRPILSFDKNFDSSPHWELLKELLIQSFGTPRNHPKSQPFIDHVMNFTIADNRIWFRNYQINAVPNGRSVDTELIEIGPRFVLNPIRVFSGSFAGSTLYKNDDYESPNEIRRAIKLASSGKYGHKLDAKDKYKKRQGEFELSDDELDDVFQE